MASMQQDGPAHMLDAPVVYDVSNYDQELQTIEHTTQPELEREDCKKKSTSNRQNQCLIKHSKTENEGIHDAKESGKKACPICKKSLSKSYSLKEHYESVHSTERKYKCAECDASYKLNKYLLLHVKKVHRYIFLKKTHANPGTRKCPICQKVLSKAYSLKEHNESVHSTERKYKCTECDASYKLNKYLLLHVRKVHRGISTKKTYANPGTRKCPICQKVLSKTYSLKEHNESVHSTERKYKCTECDASYKLNKYLLLHVKKVHRGISTKRTYGNRGMHKCPTCNKILSNNYSLKEHYELAHTTEKKYKCTECDASYKIAKYLRKHVKMFHQGIPIKEHIQTSTKSPAKFNILDIHKMYTVHERIRPAAYVEKEKDDILLNCTSEKKHECVECGTTFEVMKALLEHKKMFHPIVCLQNNKLANNFDMGSSEECSDSVNHFDKDNTSNVHDIAHKSKEEVQAFVQTMKKRKVKKQKTASNQRKIAASKTHDSEKDHESVCNRETNNRCDDGLYYEGNHRLQEVVLEALHNQRNTRSKKIVSPLVDKDSYDLVHKDEKQYELLKIVSQGQVGGTPVVAVKKSKPVSNQSIARIEKMCDVSITNDSDKHSHLVPVSNKENNSIVSYDSYEHNLALLSVDNLGDEQRNRGKQRTCKRKLSGTNDGKDCSLLQNSKGKQGKHNRTECESSYEKSQLLRKNNTPSNDSRKEIVRLHSFEKEFKCSECDMCYIRDRNLTKHVERVHQGKQETKYLTTGTRKCPICEKVLSKSYSLKDHFTIAHSTEKTHKCDECDACFKIKKYLTNHINCVHRGIVTKKYVRKPAKQNCPICEKSLSKSSLKEHVESHSSERKYKCTECDATYKVNKYLRFHVRKVHRGIPMKTYKPTGTRKCLLCKKSLSKHYSMKEHYESVHSTERKYKCSECSASYKLHKYLKKHVKKVHDGVSLENMRLEDNEDIYPTMAEIK